jgi:hypothetical protein
MNLELMALRWLWLEKKCHYVLEQRSPRYHLGSPDALGVMPSRHLIEIEIKRSASDFNADKNKCCRRSRDLFPEHMPRQFYYLMPRPLAEKLEPKIPEWAGLMYNCVSEQTCIVLKKAPVNLQSEKLTLKECAKLARCMTNHMMSLKVKIECEHRKFVNQDSLLYVHWESARKGTYEI